MDWIAQYVEWGSWRNIVSGIAFLAMIWFMTGLKFSLRMQDFPLAGATLAIALAVGFGKGDTLLLLSLGLLVMGMTAHFVLAKTASWRFSLAANALVIIAWLVLALTESTPTTLIVYIVALLLLLFHVTYRRNRHGEKKQ